MSAAALIRRGWLAVGLALAFELVVAVIDSLTDRVILTTVFVVAPVALAAVGTPSQVAAVGLLSIALALVSGLWDHYFLAVDHVTRVLIVVTGCALAVFGARARQRAEQSAVREATAREEQEHARRDAEAARAKAETVAAQLHTTRQQLDQILGALADAVTVEDASGKTVFANPAALELMGLSSRDELLAADPGELFSRFENRTEDGSLVKLEDLPGRRLLRGSPQRRCSPGGGIWPAARRSGC